MKKYLVIGFAFIFLVTGITLGSLHLMRGDPVLANPPPVYVTNQVGDILFEQIGATNTSRVIGMHERLLGGAYNPTTGTAGGGVHLNIPQICPAGRTVTEVNGDGTFRATGNVNRGNIVQVTIPPSVLRINNNTWIWVGAGNTAALSSNLRTGLANQSIRTLTFTAPSSLQYIGFNVFRNNLIESLTLPPNIVHIGHSAFAWNNIAGALIIPAGVTNIGGGGGGGAGFTHSQGQHETGAFRNNPNITSLTIQGNPIIGQNAFANCGIATLNLGNLLSSIQYNPFTGNPFTTVTIPASMITLGTNAFWGSSALTSVTFSGNNLTSIGVNAFINSNLSTVTIPASVTTIGTQAFYNNALTSVTFSGNNLTSIGESAFRNNNLSTVAIPASVTIIWNNAFLENAMSSVTFSGNNLTSIGAGAFAHNQFTALPTNFPTSLTTLNGFNNNQIATATIQPHFTAMSTNALAHNFLTTLPVIPAGMTALNGFMGNNITNLVIPNHITAIGDQAFQVNLLTGTLAIPASVTSIGISAFGGDALRNHLTGLTFTGVSNLVTIGVNAFTNNIITSLAVPASVVTIGNDAFRGNNLSTLTFTGTNLMTIGNNAFHSNALVNLTLPAGLVTLGNNSFTNNSITAVNIPPLVVTVGAAAFMDNNLSTLTFEGTNVTTIATDAFRNNVITTVTIPNGTMLIQPNAFRNNNLSSLTLPTTLSATLGLQYSAFRDNFLTTVTIPGNVTTIADSVFQNNALSSVNFLAPVNSIGTSAFRDNNLNNLAILPSGLLFLGNNAFSENLFTALPTIPLGITTLGAAFNMNPLMTSATIPPHVLHIGNSALHSNGLTSIIIPHTVQTIQHAAFMNNALVSLTIQAGALTVIPSEAFRNNLLTNVIIPAQIVEIQVRAFMENMLNSLTFAGNNITAAGIAVNAFAHNQFVALPVIPVGVTTLQGFGFNQITNLVVPAHIVTIGNHAFEGNAMVGVSFAGDNVETIGQGAFLDNNIVRLYIPSSVRIIAGWHITGSGSNAVVHQGAFTRAFAPNIQNPSVFVPGTVTTLHHRPFADNGGLRIFTDVASTAAAGWQGLWYRAQAITTGNAVHPVVWNALRNPAIQVSAVGGTATVVALSSPGFTGTGSGTSSVNGTVNWADELHLVLNHPSTVLEIRVNGQTLTATGGTMTGNSASWARGNLNAISTSLILTHIGHDLEIEILSQSFNLSIEVGPEAGAGNIEVQGGLTLSNLQAGTQRTFIATPSQGWGFSHWELTGSGTIATPNNSTTMFTTGAANSMLTAVFAASWNISVGMSHVGASAPITWTGGPLDNVVAGQSRIFTAHTNQGWEFLGWTVAPVTAGIFSDSSLPTSQFTLTETSAVITAMFRPLWNITLGGVGGTGVNDVEGGTANVTGGALVGLPEDAQRNLIAMNNSGWRFTHWTYSSGTIGDATNPVTTITVTNFNIIVVANFEPHFYTVDLDAGPGTWSGTPPWFNHRVGTTPLPVEVPINMGFTLVGFYDYTPVTPVRIFDGLGLPVFGNWVIDGPRTLVARWIITLPHLNAPTGINVSVPLLALRWASVTDAVDYTIIFMHEDTELATTTQDGTIFDLTIIRSMIETHNTITVRIIANGDGVTYHSSIPSVAFSLNYEEIFGPRAGTTGPTLFDQVDIMVIVGVVIGMAVLAILLFAMMMKRKGRQNVART